MNLSSWELGFHLVALFY